MTRQEFDELRSRIEREYRENLAALERVGRLVGIEAHVDILPQQPAARNESGQSKNGVQLKGGLLSKGWLIAAVRASVRNIDGTFTAQQVADRLKSTIPSAKRNSIKAALERLLAGKVIERVERGYGRTETTYRNKEEK